MFQKDWVVVHYDVSPRHFQEVSTIVHGFSASIWGVAEKANTNDGFWAEIWGVFDETYTKNTMQFGLV